MVATKRTRMAPEARMAQLVGVTRDLLAADGVDGFTIDRLAERAGVSPQLVYNYFENRATIFEHVLRMEYARYRDDILERLREADGFVDVVRVYVTSNFDHQAPGSVLAQLLERPELRKVAADLYRRDDPHTRRSLYRALETEQHVDVDLAELVLTMGSGASQAAAGVAARRALPREETIEQTVAFVIAGLRAVLGDVERRSP